MKRVALYMRVSTEEQALHGYSLPAQRDALTQYAKDRDMIVAGEYIDEGISGRKPASKRPALSQMLRDIEAGKIDQVLFIKLDRWFRSVKEYYKVQEILDRHKVTWRAVLEDYNTESADGILKVNIMLSVAQNEAERTSERIRFVMQNKVQRGEVISGTVPWCFKIEMREGKKVIVKNPETAHIMEDLIEYYLTTHSKRKTLFYINGKYDLNLSHTALSHLLKNEKICGCYRGNLNYCEAYIDRQTFDRIQQISGYQNIKANANEPYLFSGLLRCPVCGSRLAGFRAAYSSRKYKEDPIKYRYKKYRCPKHAKSGICTYPKTISENVLERIVVERIEDALISAEIRLGQEKKKRSDHGRLKQKKAEIEAEIGRLNYAWQKGRLQPEEYDKQYELLTSKLDSLTSVSDSEHDNVIRLDQVRAALSGNWKEIYAGLDDSHKQAFWVSIIHSIELVEWEVGRRDILIHFF